MFSKFLFFIKNDIKHIKKTSLKKFKGQSEAANQRWTDSLMAKRKGTSNDLKKTPHRKPNVEQHEHHQNKTGIELGCSGNIFLLLDTYSELITYNQKNLQIKGFGKP